MWIEKNKIKFKCHCNIKPGLKFLNYIYIYDLNSTEFKLWYSIVIKLSEMEIHWIELNLITIKLNFNHNELKLNQAHIQLNQFQISELKLNGIEFQIMNYTQF